MDNTDDLPEPPWDFPTKSADDIDPRTVEMIERGIENMKNGNVSDPIDFEEDFPDIFDDEE